MHEGIGAALCAPAGTEDLVSQLLTWHNDGGTRHRCGQSMLAVFPEEQGESWFIYFHRKDCNSTAVLALDWKAFNLYWPLTSKILREHVRGAWWQPGSPYKKAGEGIGRYH